MLECPRSFDANSDVFGALQEGIAAEPQSREGDMATHLVERHLLDGVSRNLAAAQEVAGSLDWQWFVTAVETVSRTRALPSGSSVACKRGDASSFHGSVANHFEGYYGG